LSQQITLQRHLHYEVALAPVKPLVMSILSVELTFPLTNDMLVAARAKITEAPHQR
jgi:hypothetical protein